MQRISLLDCTLRDGAHVNAGNFGQGHIVNIINKVSDSLYDIVEIGFLKNVVYNPDVTSYPQIEHAQEILSRSKSNTNTMYALMARADEYDISKLSPCTGPIKLIRIAFYYDYLEKAIDFAKEVKKKGYLFTLNLINTPGNSINRLNKLIEHANEIQPYALMIVDTFGVLDVNQLVPIILNYDKKLDRNIKLGLHAHENLSLSLSLAQTFIQTVNLTRNIIIDSSLMGMGRAPGNLCTELIANHVNMISDKKYNLSPILAAISEDIASIKNNHKWGYSPEYFLSAKYCVHRSYAEYLSNKDLDYRSIDLILSHISPEFAEKFDKNYLELLISKYLIRDCL